MLMNPANGAISVDISTADRPQTLVGDFFAFFPVRGSSLDDRS